MSLQSHSYKSKYTHTHKNIPRWLRPWPHQISVTIRTILYLYIYTIYIARVSSTFRRRTHNPRSQPQCYTRSSSIYLWFGIEFEFFFPLSHIKSLAAQHPFYNPNRRAFGLRAAAPLNPARDPTGKDPTTRTQYTSNDKKIPANNYYSHPPSQAQFSIRWINGRISIWLGPGGL